MPSTLTTEQALKRGIKAHENGNFEEADRYYTAILKAIPHHPDANHNMGLLAVDCGKEKEAIPFLEKALEVNPKIEQFWISCLETLLKMNKTQDARNLVLRAKQNGINSEFVQDLEIKIPTSDNQGSTTNVKKDPSAKQIRLLTDLYRNGLLEETLNNAGELWLKYPNSPALHNICGVANAGLGKFELAIEHYEKAIQEKLNFSHAFNNMGLALIQLDRLDDALDNFNEALKIDAEYPDALYNFGILLQIKGDLDGSIVKFKKAIELSPSNVNAHYNLGNTLLKKENFKAAIDSYKTAVKLKPDFTNSFINMGNAYKELGDFDAAIKNFRKALEIAPDNALACLNLGIVLNTTNDFETAIYNFQKAIDINPVYAEAYFNLGITFAEKGDINAAVNSYKKAVKINPNYADAYNNLAAQLIDQNNYEVAINYYYKAIKIKPSYITYYNLANTLTNVTFNSEQNYLFEVIETILEFKTLVRPREIANVTINLLRHNSEFSSCLGKASKNFSIETALDIIKKFIDFPVFLKLISICAIPDLEIEKVLTFLRSKILEHISELESSSELFQFQSALAQHCFANEYVFNLRKSESVAIKKLENSVKNIIRQGVSPKPTYLLCLASYQSLSTYDWSKSLTNQKDFEEVFKLQVTEPEVELRIKNKISSLKGINDPISYKVKEQYEVNPYPRWVNLGLPFEPHSIGQVIEKCQLNLHDKKISQIEAPKILIAGCGTGQHPIGTARRFKNSEVTAIDLSLSSLAYAKRKTEELGFQNIQYMQADILDVKKLNKKFHIIESVGVLHHMSEPKTGWSMLTDCLENGGLMRVGLYSELARKDIVKVREEIDNLGIKASNSEIIAFREKLKNSNNTIHKRIHKFGDFYNLSETRDLLFHVQEHLFTIPKITRCLRELGLQFCGFENPFLLQNFKDSIDFNGNLCDLDKWNNYEHRNPSTFNGMYQFWCQK